MTLLRRQGVGRAAGALLLLLGLASCSASATPQGQAPAPASTRTEAAASAPATASTGPGSRSSPVSGGAATGTSTPGAPRTTPVTAAATTVATNAQIIARSTVPALCYHRVRPITDDDGGFSAAITVPPKLLTEQLSALRQAGYHSISPQQLRAHLVTAAALPAKPILITFDDGTRPQWTVAGPILAKEGFTATFFPMTVVLNKDGWLRDSDQRALHAAGMTIGSHTWDPHDVRDYTKKDWKVQLTGSQRTLSTAIGAPVTTFAFPYGAWNDQALAPLAANGVQIAFQLTDKPISTTAPLLTQRRLLMTNSLSGKELLGRIASAFPQR